MSAGPYECLHVPVKAAQVRVFGLPLWVLWLAVAAVAVKLYGPWLVLAPVLVLTTILAVVILRAVRTTTAPAGGVGEASGPSDSPGVLVDALTGAPVVVLSGTGSLPCMGCGTDPALSVLEVSGYRIPVCGPCRDTAETRLAAMLAGGRVPEGWRALE